MCGGSWCCSCRRLSHFWLAVPFCFFPASSVSSLVDCCLDALLLWLISLCCGCLVSPSLFVVVACCLVAPFCRGIVVVNSVPTGVAPCCGLRSYQPVSLLAAAYNPTRYVVTPVYSIVLSSCISPVLFLLLLSWRQTPWRIGCLLIFRSVGCWSLLI